MINIFSELVDVGIEDKSEAILHARQILQLIVLNGLSRGNFFKKAIFQGGTALRIIHEIDRFSEDLDFLLIEKDPEFKLDRYIKYVESEIRSYGLDVKTKVREYYKDNISSGDIRLNLKEVIIEFGFNRNLTKALHPDAVIKIKIDVDTNPPSFATYHCVQMDVPLNYYVRVLDIQSLFAGKLSAVISRQWGHRIKGRDLYDFLWYVDNGYGINMDYLRANLIREGKIQEDEELDRSRLRDLLHQRFDSIDYVSAKEDISLFVNSDTDLSNWGPELFKSYADRLTSEGYADIRE